MCMVLDLTLERSTAGTACLQRSACLLSAHTFVVCELSAVSAHTTAFNSCLKMSAFKQAVRLAGPSSGTLSACFHLTSDIDIVVVGCRGMFSKEVIGKMKKGAYLINNARGAIVDREAVVEACKSGQLGGTGPTSPPSVGPRLLPSPPLRRVSPHFPPLYVMLPTVPIICLPSVLPSPRLSS